MKKKSTLRTSISTVVQQENSEGKASLKRQRTPETTTDTKDVSKFYWFNVQNVHISKYLSW